MTLWTREKKKKKEKKDNMYQKNKSVQPFESVFVGQYSLATVKSIKL